MARPEESRPAAWSAGTSLAWLGDLGVGSTLAEILATVDIDRALANLGRSGRPLGFVVPPVDDPLLGARVAVVPGADGDVAIALAEPSTEGRLAATLARHGEGSAGRYVRSPIHLDALRDRAAAAGVSITRPAPGPFGLAVLVVASVAGPHLILVDPSPVSGEPPAVPSRP